MKAIMITFLIGLALCVRGQTNQPQDGAKDYAPSLTVWQGCPDTTLCIDATSMPDTLGGTDYDCVCYSEFSHRTGGVYVDSDGTFASEIGCSYYIYFSEYDCKKIQSGLQRLELFFAKRAWACDSLDCFALNYKKLQFIQQTIYKMDVPAQYELLTELTEK